MTFRRAVTKVLLLTAAWSTVLQNSAFSFPGRVVTRPDSSQSVLHNTESDDVIRILPGPSDLQPGGPTGPDITVPSPGNPGGPPSGGASQLSGKMVQLPVTMGAGADGVQGSLGVNFKVYEDPSIQTLLGINGKLGAFVFNTVPGSAAADAGLHFGDVIMELDGKPVPSQNDLVQAVRAIPAGKAISVNIWRYANDGTGSLQALRDQADAGNIPTMLFLGDLYSNGSGMSRDDSEAVKWFRKAALAGSTTGMLWFGLFLNNGRGTVKDPTEAARWIKQAADAENIAAVHTLGIMYRNGEGVEKDPLEALNLLKKAADNGFSPSMVEIGSMFNGDGGLATDHLQAVQWFKKAADAGNTLGMESLGLNFFFGKGVQKDFPTALTWFRKSAGMGSLQAYLYTAIMLDNGQGVDRNPYEAADLVYAAVQAGHTPTYNNIIQNNRAWTREFRKAIQQKLAAAGYYQGKINGTFGDTTVSALQTLLNGGR